jgi:hypothetical protein
MSFRDKWRFNLSPTLCGAMGMILMACLHTSAIASCLSKKEGSRFLFNIMNYPHITFLDLYAKFFKGGNTDQMLGPWLFLSFPLYWVVSSIGVGIVFYVIADFLSRD